MPCIMPEQPYCPACHYGFITKTFDDPDEFCEWHCRLTEEEYARLKEEAEFGRT